MKDLKVGDYLIDNSDRLMMIDLMNTISIHFTIVETKEMYYTNDRFWIDSLHRIPKEVYNSNLFKSVYNRN